MSSSLWCNGRLVAERVHVASSVSSRMRGLLGKEGLPSGHALVLEPARQVHTVGMRFPIDVAFCDEEGAVLHVVREMRPWRVTRYVRRARRAVEMRAGGLASVSEGQVLEVLQARGSSNPVS